MSDTVLPTYFSILALAHPWKPQPPYRDTFSPMFHHMSHAIPYLPSWQPFPYMEQPHTQPLSFEAPCVPIGSYRSQGTTIFSFPEYSIKNHHICNVTMHPPPPISNRLLLTKNWIKVHLRTICDMQFTLQYRGRVVRLRGWQINVYTMKNTVFVHFFIYSVCGPIFISTYVFVGKRLE